MVASGDFHPGGAVLQPITRVHPGGAVVQPVTLVQLVLPVLMIQPIPQLMRVATMKAKRGTKIAKGRYAKAVVFRGTKEKTAGGLNKGMLIKNKRGKIVSKKAAASGRRAYSNIKGWTDAVVAARKALSVTGFVAVNGRGSIGKALYAKAKSLVA